MKTQKIPDVADFKRTVRRLLDTKENPGQLLATLFAHRTSEGRQLCLQAVIQIIRSGELSSDARYAAFEVLYDLAENDPEIRLMINSVLREVCGTILSLPFLTSHGHEKSITLLSSLLTLHQTHGGDPQQLDILSNLARLRVMGDSATFFILNSLLPYGIAGAFPTDGKLATSESWKQAVGRDLYQQAVSLARSEEQYGLAAAFSCVIDPRSNQSFELIVLAQANDAPIDMLHGVTQFESNFQRILPRDMRQTPGAILMRDFQDSPEGQRLIALRQTEKLSDPNSLYRLTADGAIVLREEDRAGQYLVEHLLSHGQWGEAGRLQRELSIARLLPDSACWREGYLLMPALFHAERHGRIGTAAALGQMALAGHRKSHERMSSPIARPISSCADMHFQDRTRELKDEEIRTRGRHEKEDMEVDGLGCCHGYMKQVFTNPRTPELETKLQSLNTDRETYIAELTQRVLKLIDALLVRAITERTPLELDLF